MALRRQITQLPKQASRVTVAKFAPASTTTPWLAQSQCLNNPRHSMATVVPPVTQDATSSKGPTAMVFMNMGGPSTTDEVGGFLSRLFVCHPCGLPRGNLLIIGNFIGRRGSNTVRPAAKLPWSPHLSPPNPKDPETVRSYRRRLSYSQMVRIPIFGDVQDP